ncbi:sodium-coupled monocarboxylate transporter 1 isoform X1 [Nematostella vectensis]|uniref:sodium-coupled monocarboxylate transporter 1 isoform X1 n=1 Tax=Nematostella vectensis TaxID=45351 RepID=UPI002076E3B4|nr:sodium-coupled monocarboxylate transporter 1 isoform X1 [Nematostella vectensis]
MADLHEHFTTIDFIVFAATLAASAGIGVYFARVGSRNQSNSEYLMASRSMSAIPVAISVLASFVSSIAVLGTPNEVYSFGFQYWLLVFSSFVTIPLVAYVYLPVYYNLKLTSAYEYLELRFSKSVKLLASSVFIIQTLLYIAIVLYGPSLTLEAVTGFPLWIAIITIGLVCTFYTTLGGMKAVIWTDVFQGVVMLGGLLAVIAVGTSHVGGISKVFEIAKHGSRFDIDWSGDPTHRLTFWVIILTGMFQNLPVYTTNQTAVQRFLTCKSFKDAIRSVWLNLPLQWLNTTLTVLVGLVLYAYYATCDPLTAGSIEKGDEILPFFVVEVLGKSAPGMPGVFVASLFCATLSTVASGLNSLAAVTVEDFISMYTSIPKDKETLVSKCLVIVYGFISLGLAFLASKLGMILQMSASMFGIIGGPMLALFTMGILTRTANSKGVWAGMIAGFVVITWISVGAQVQPPDYPILPISVAGCASNTSALNITMPHIARRGMGSNSVYSISFFLYGPIGFIITLVVAMLISIIFKDDQSPPLDPRLFFDVHSCITKATKSPCNKSSLHSLDSEEESSESSPLYHDSKIH